MILGTVQGGLGSMNSKVVQAIKPRSGTHPHASDTRKKLLKVVAFLATNNAVRIGMPKTAMLTLASTANRNKPLEAGSRFFNAYQKAASMPVVQSTSGIGPCPICKNRGENVHIAAPKTEIPSG